MLAMLPTKLTKERKASGLLWLAAFLWGSSFVGSKICLNAGLFPFETVFYRMAAGTAMMGLLFHRQLRHIPKPAALAGVSLGVITSAVYAFEMYGVSMTEAAKASFLTSSSTVMMPFLYAAFFRTRPSPRSVLAGLLALAGVWFLSLAGAAAGSGIALGDLLLLVTAFLYAMNSIAADKLGRDSSPAQVTFLQFLTTMAFTGVMTLFQGRCGSYPAEVIGALAYLSVGPTMICFFIKNYAIQLVSPVKCTLILATEGVFCAVLSMLLLHETLTLSMCFGILLILCGVLTEELGTLAWKRAKAWRAAHSRRASSCAPPRQEE